MLILLFLFINQVFSQTINFKNYTVLDGLANSTVYHTLQDSKGFLWIGTSSGVNRFDGKNFENFTTDNGLADNEVLSIYEDSKGRIWFLNFNGKLGYYSNGKFYNQNNSKLLKRAVIKASIIGCFEDSKHRLWFSTNQQQIIEIDNKEVRVHFQRKKELDISNNFIFEDTKNRIVAANTKGFYSLKENIISPYAAPYLPVSYKSQRFDNKSRNLLFLSEKGLIEFKNDEFKIVRSIPEQIIKSKMGSFFINKNDLWISSINSGLYILKAGKENLNHYLPETLISAIMLDRNKNIWVSTLGDGLIILPEHTGNIVQYTKSSGLPENSIYSIFKEDNGKTWLGSKSGILTFIDKGKIRNLNLNTTGNPFDPIKKLEYDKERNSVWFASSNAIGEIDLKNPEGKKRYLKEKNNLKFAVKSFSISKKGKFAFSLASGVYILEDKNKPLVFETEVNLPNQVFFPDRSFKIFYDSKERLWFSNVNGLFRYYDNKVDTLSKYSKVLLNRVTDIVELPDGKTMIGTYGEGIIILDSTNKVTRMGTKDGLTSNICRKLAFDGKYIWLTTFSGVDKFEYNSSNKTISTYKIKNGLTSNEVLDIYINHDKVYLGTNGGLTILPRNAPSTKFNSPPFYITQLSINGKLYDINSVPILKFDQNSISVKYTAINFTQSNEYYQYRLKENSPWIATTSEAIEFGSLEPGNYNLSIRAKIQDSPWSKPANIKFKIKPAYWQRWWFQAAIYSIISIIVITLIYQYFKKQRSKEQEKLSVQTKIIALEQRALQAMMNPHFVFNIMNSIQYFINSNDSHAANQVLTEFARLIRKNLEICTKSSISLEEEIDYLKLYLSLEKLRFGDKMSYEIRIKEDIDTEETMIPTMLLQPFVENAIWHGVMPKNEGGIINIEIQCLDSMLNIYIKDNGMGIENSKKIKNSNHVSRGMQITQDRVNLLNQQNKGQISIQTRQTGSFGTEVLVKIPA
ncbi:ligand-binding sensor domain-containing protein [Daejeonella oryzae]|uniref:ligand-binding sensor domain-containing protein n=1 Tax=Daejeonella oryzae TaxID=1122943 RepID=UPI00138AE207|nr:two-component regulator propeller domain-containing protein [Daejeonella oryzae]